MEEADHLADRVGVLAKRMLDIGSTSHLRAKHGHGFHIHLISSTAPHTSTDEMEQVRAWIEEMLPGAKAEGLPYHGQMRFSIPAHPALEQVKPLPPPEEPSDEMEITHKGVVEPAGVSIGALFVLLEENKKKLGLEFYSVSPSTFDEVFLRVVEKHNVGEEDRPEVKKDWRYWVRKVGKLVFFVPL